MSETKKIHSRFRSQGRAPHPATVVQRSAPHPATSAQRKAAHPATVTHRSGARPATSTRKDQPPSLVAQQAKWNTVVKASARGQEKTGKSGNGEAVGHLLTRSPASSATDFLAILKWLRSEYPDRRSPFTCAEPHAVAQIIAATGADLDEITVHTAADSFGGKDTCPICSEWLMGGKIFDPRPTAPRRTQTAFSLAAFVVEKAPKKPKRSAAKPASTSAPSVRAPRKFWDEDYGMTHSGVSESDDIDWREE